MVHGSLTGIKLLVIIFSWPRCSEVNWGFKENYPVYWRHVHNSHRFDPYFQIDVPQFTRVTGKFSMITFRDGQKLRVRSVSVSESMYDVIGQTESKADRGTNCAAQSFVWFISGSIFNNYKYFDVCDFNFQKSVPTMIDDLTKSAVFESRCQITDGSVICNTVRFTG